MVAGGFGFPDALSRLGIERRVHTAGDSKAMLDPFKPEDADDVARLQETLDDLHTQFIDLVKSRRSGKLTEDKEIFSGAIWTGPKAQEKGLIDGTAQLGDFLRAHYGKDVRIKRISSEGGSLLRRLLSGGAAKAWPAAPLIDAEAMLEAAERRAMWSRFGL